jgi:hypothetical protein
LHYLELRENPKRLWRKCPICWDSIYEADLKPVRIMKPFAVSDHRSATAGKASLSCGVTEGDRVEMILIQRNNHSTLAFPLSDTWPLPPNVISNYVKPDVPLIPWHFTPAAMNFARFMLASPDYLEAEYNRDCIELDEAMSDAQGWGSTEELPFIESSISMCQKKRKLLHQQRTKDVELSIQTWNMMFEAVAKYSKKHGKAPSQQHIEREQVKDNAVPEAYLQYHLNQAGNATELEKPAATVTTTTTATTTTATATAAAAATAVPARYSHHHQANHDNTPATDFYFYQAIDGQHVYLHPLDIRILKHEFGEYDQFPRTLQVQATNVQESTLTEELRKKCKYLGHLPLACDVTFLEINVKDIVSPETIQVYNRKFFFFFLYIYSPDDNYFFGRGTRSQSKEEKGQRKTRGSKKKTRRVKAKITSG